MYLPESLGSHQPAASWRSRSWQWSISEEIAFTTNTSPGTEPLSSSSWALCQSFYHFHINFLVGRGQPTEEVLKFEHRLQGLRQQQKCVIRALFRRTSCSRGAFRRFVSVSLFDYSLERIVPYSVQQVTLLLLRRTLFRREPILVSRVEEYTLLSRLRHREVARRTESMNQKQWTYLCYPS